jgi:hypothetical protein
MRSWQTVHFLALLFLASACGGGDSPAEPPDDNGPVPTTNFDFLDGTWTVASTYLTANGPVQETGVANITQSLGGRVRKEHWVGTRDGQTVEMWTMFGKSEHQGLWLIVRADGGTGTLDIDEGSWTSGVGTFTTRPDTRIDSGRERIRIDSIANESFRWQAERSTDEGVTWNVYWTMHYTRGSGTSPTPADPAPACASSEYHEFDFWIGGWDVSGARSDIKRLLGGCLVEENWFANETGTSFNMYDPRSQRWTQVWFDTNNSVLLIQGGIVNGDMVLVGPRVSPNNRITWTPLPNHYVRQLGENSPNGGNTWNTIYDLTYIPR